MCVKNGPEEAEVHEARRQRLSAGLKREHGFVSVLDLVKTGQEHQAGQKSQVFILTRPDWSPSIFIHRKDKVSTGTKFGNDLEIRVCLDLSQAL